MATTGTGKMKTQDQDREMGGESLRGIQESVQQVGSDLTRAIGDRVSHLADNVQKGAGDLVNKAGHVATDFASKAQEYGEMAVDETSSFIRRYPTQSLIAGFGVGLLVGIGLARR